MNIDEFRQHAHLMVDWMADYLSNIEQYPVKSTVTPREVYNSIAPVAPKEPEDMATIFQDFEAKILPGITHWQHPNFHAYFSGNSSYPSVLAEMLTATLGAQCMIWDTSPAAAELEEKMMNWLKQMMNLPLNWDGVIQDTASTATLASILTAREKCSNFQINRKGFQNNEELRIYCSQETHSSIEKAVKIAGIGSDNLVKILVDEHLAMDTKNLEAAILADLKQNKVPLCVVATLGTTGTTAIDPLFEISKICQRYDIWLHVDAAFAGTALLLEEYRDMVKGIEAVDTFVFNPHKWMFTNFDCSVYFVKDKQALIKTFEIMPEYLKTNVDHLQINNYRDWGVPLGRRFRALKLWFVMRSFGENGLKERLRHHIKMAKDLAIKIENHGNFEMVMPTHFNMITFRCVQNKLSLDQLNDLNRELNTQLNQSGKVYLTHTTVNQKYILRMVIGKTYVEQQHVDMAWQLIQDIAKRLI